MTDPILIVFHRLSYSWSRVSGFTNFVHDCFNTESSCPGKLVRINQMSFKGGPTRRDTSQEYVAAATFYKLYT